MAKKTQKKQRPVRSAAPKTMETDDAEQTGEKFESTAEREIPEEEPMAEAPVEAEPAGPVSVVSKPMALAISILLIICILFLGFLFVQSMKNAISQGNGAQYGTLTGNDAALTQQSATAIKNNAECLSTYGLDPKTPLFVYRETCPYCVEILPTMKGLEQKGYVFSWVDVSNSDNVKMLYGCFADLVKGTPQLICPGTRKERAGVLTENEVIAFVNECRGA